MTFCEASDWVTNQGNGDMLEGMEGIRESYNQLECQNLIYSPSMIRSLQAYNIVFEGLDKLFNGDK
jgi:hypothetical protein